MTELRHIKETDIEEQEINKSEPTDLSSEGNPKRYISRKKKLQHPSSCPEGRSFSFSKDQKHLEGEFSMPITTEFRTMLFPQRGLIYSWDCWKDQVSVQNK